MNNEQFRTIVGLMSGMQLCIIHLAKVVAHKTEIDIDSLATSFEETAANVPANVADRELFQTAARQVAAGLRDSTAGPEWSKLMDRLLRK